MELSAPTPVSARRVDTLLAIASRRDERRTLPEPLPSELVHPAARRGPALGLVEERAALDVRRADEPGQRSRSSRRAVYVPENVLGAGLVVAILVHGKGPVLFDAGRAAQSMLLAAWAEGIASCPNGIKDADLARDGARGRGRRDARDRALVRIPGASRATRACTRPPSGARGRTASRSSEVVRWLP